MFAKNEAQALTRRYESVEDARARLDQTIVRFNGNVVFLTWDGRRWVYYNMASMDDPRVGDDPRPVNIDDPRLDISSPPLGYVMSRRNGILWYVQRTSQRQFKQGLTARVCQLEPDQEDARASGLMRGSWPFAYTDLERTINGQYPSVEQAWNAVLDGVTQAEAFARHFAFSRLSPDIVRLKNMGITIGYIRGNEPTPRVCLLSGNEVFISALEEHGILLT